MIQSKIFLAALFTSITLHAGFFLLSGNPLKFESGKPKQKTAVRVSILNTPAANGKPVMNYPAAKPQGIQFSPPLRGGDEGEGEKNTLITPTPTLPPQGGGGKGYPMARPREIIKFKTVEPPIKKIAVGKSIGLSNKKKVKIEETPYQSFREPEPDIAGVEPATLPAPQGEIEGVRGAVPAGGIGIIRPRYPVFSRRLGEEGRVVLLVKIGADGTINDISTSSSSGYPRLDRAAVEAVKNSVFEPELRVNTPVPSTKTIAFTFKLKD